MYRDCGTSGVTVPFLRDHVVTVHHKHTKNENVAYTFYAPRMCKNCALIT